VTICLENVGAGPVGITLLVNPLVSPFESACWKAGAWNMKNKHNRFMRVKTSVFLPSRGGTSREYTRWFHQTPKQCDFRHRRFCHCNLYKTL